MAVANHMPNHTHARCCCYRYGDEIGCCCAATVMGSPRRQRGRGWVRRFCWRHRGWVWIFLLVIPVKIVVQTIINTRHPAARTTRLWRRWSASSSPSSAPSSSPSAQPSSSSPKPYWLSLYPGNDRDMVSALVNRLMMPLDVSVVGSNAMVVPVAAKGFNDTCLHNPRGPIPGTATCATMYPIPNYMGGWNPSPRDYAHRFQSKVIVVLRNPAESIPEFFNDKNMGLSNIGGWRANRDTWLNPDAILEWVSTLSAWTNMPEYDGVGLYLAYEDLLDPIQGPIATQKLARMLSDAGFALGVEPDNATAMDFVWNQAVPDRIRSRRLPFAADYVVGYTADQKQTMVDKLRDIQQRYVNDTDLVAILNQYVVAIPNIPEDAPEIEPITNMYDVNTSDLILSGENVSPSKEGSLQLRLDWTNLERHSSHARRIAMYQNNCSLPVAYYAVYHYGLGSNLHIYGSALCKAMELGEYRLRPLRPWLWLDVEQCATYEQNATNATNAAWQSALSCYFPESEGVCPTSSQEGQPLIIVPQQSTHEIGCGDLENAFGGRPSVRAAMTEFLFTRVSPLVQQEAHRQLQLVFGPPKDGRPTVGPTNLITVHMRWGDKSAEMELVKVEHYIHAINSLLNDEEAATTEPDVVNIFLATEDPEALAEFRAAAQPHWTIYVDQYYTEMMPYRVPGYNGFLQMARRLSGRPGLVALGSALVAMQANRFVLTTGSNWSRLLNELRKNVVDPRCNNCTRIVDLLPGEW